MSDFLTELDKIRHENNSLEQPRELSFTQALNEIQNNNDYKYVPQNNSLEQSRGLSFEQTLNEIQNNRNYQSLPQQKIQPQAEEGETELHKALRELGTPDWLNDYVLEPYIRTSGNLVSGAGNTFIRGWMNVPALIARGIGAGSEALLGGESMFTQVANAINDADAKYVELSDAYRHGLTGDNPTFWDNVVHGVGTSLGYMGYGKAAEAAAGMLGAGKTMANIARFVTENLSEALTEAGNTTSELYAQDKNRGNDALWAGIYSLVPNAGLDAMQGFGEGILKTALDKTFFPNTKGFWKELAREGAKVLIREEVDENLQEPRQQLIEEAAKKTFNSGDMSLRSYVGNLGEEASKFGDYFKQTFPETAASTALTSLITLGIGAEGAYTAQKQAQQQIDEINNQIYNTLKAKHDNLQTTINLRTERDNLQERINAIYENLSSGNTDDEGMSFEIGRAADFANIGQMEQRLKEINEKIAGIKDFDNTSDIADLRGQLQDTNTQISNFWRNTDYDTDIISPQDRVQDDAGIDLYPDADEINKNSTVPVMDNNTADTAPVPDTQQPQDIPPIYDADTATAIPKTQTTPLATVMGANLGTITAPNENATNINPTSNVQNNEPDLIADVDDDISPMDMLFGNRNTQNEIQQNNITEDFSDVEDEPDINLDNNFTDYGEQYNQSIPGTYNQSNNNNQDNAYSLGTFVFSTNSNDYELNVVLTEDNANDPADIRAQRIKRWNGRYIEIRNKNGKVLATYYPQFGTFSLSPDIAVKHSLRWRQKFEHDFKANISTYLQSGGLADENGTLKPDGNEAFRKRWSKKIGAEDNSFNSNTIQPEDLDAKPIGTLSVSYQNDKGTETTQDLSVVLGEFGDNMPEQKQYFGQYFDIIDSYGRTVARYAPHTGSLRFTKATQTGMKQAVFGQLKRQARTLMRKAGFLDNNGKLIPDGNEAFRAKRKADNNIPSSMPKQIPIGKNARIRTIKGTETDVRYRIMDANDIIVSTNEAGTPNPNFPQEWQPRDRTREASFEQIARMSSNIDPELLAENRLASDGAPVITPNGITISGNGRMLALQRGYRYGTADNYRSWINKNAARFGINPDSISDIKNPVLVREINSDINLAQFAREANESSTSGMSMTEHALNDADKITPDMLSLFDPEKTIPGNKDFLQAFSRIIPQSEKNDFYQKNGKISKAGLDRVLNALLAKAYNDTGILDRLNEIYDDDIKNVSNALTQAAPKLAMFENGRYSPDLSIRDDIAQAVRKFAELKSEGETVASYMSQISMFNDDNLSDTAINLLQFFDRNSRRGKRIATGLIQYAENAMRQVKQGQSLMFSDIQQDKSTILNTAINAAETETSSKSKSKAKGNTSKIANQLEILAQETQGNKNQSETYNQSTQNEQEQQSWRNRAANAILGFLGINNNSTTTVTDTQNNAEGPAVIFKIKGADEQEHTLTARKKNFSDKYKEAQQYHGSYIELTDENKQIVARWSPYSKQFRMANIQDANAMQQEIINLLYANRTNLLQSLGYTDEYGRLKSDGNENFRRKYRARKNTTPKGKTEHPDNLNTQQATKKKDTRSIWQRLKETKKKFDNAKEERKAYNRTRHKVRRQIYNGLRQFIQDKDIDEIESNLPEYKTLLYQIMFGDDTKDLTPRERKRRIHRYITKLADAYSHVITARINAAAHLAGMSVEDYHKLWNLRFVKSDIEGARGQTEFVPAGYNDDNVWHNAETIIHLTQLHNESTILHEFAHIFFRDYQDLIATVDDLPSQVKKDWLYLARWLGISDIDPKSTHGTRTEEERQRMLNAQEKFAIAFEQYYMTGKAPKSRLQRVFNYFKDWMTSIYHGIQNIRYTGSDEREHDVELSPEVKQIFGRMLKGSSFYTPNAESARARIERTNNPQHGGELNKQTASGQNSELSTGRQSNNETQHIEYSDNTLVSQKDIERFNQLVAQGTSHIILDNKFNLKYIGTGEGAQVFGWGIYFAQNPKVAEDYRRYGRTITILNKNGQPISAPDNVIKILQEYFNSFTKTKLDNNFSEVKDRIISTYEMLINEAKADIRKISQTGKTVSEKRLEKIRNNIKLYNDAINVLNNVSAVNVKNGNLYFADIPENDVLLDWDATLEHQPEHVKQGIKKIIAKLSKNNPSVADKLYNATDGSHFYHTLKDIIFPLVKNGAIKSSKYGVIKRADMAVSLLLNQAGIPGLRYFDYFSRKNKSGTHNFVIWNTDMIKLLGLRSDSDEDAKQYFKEHARSDMQGSSEIYHQTAGLARTEDDFLYIKKQYDAQNAAEAKRQYDAVVQKYRATPQWMKAPNGKKTNLTEKQWVIVRTENFKRWFGDWENDPANASKVLDANGEPLVVYHGTPNGSFNTFKIIGEGGAAGTGAWFMNNRNVAQTYTRNAQAGRVYATFLNIRNPYVLDAKNKGWNELAVVGRKIITTDHVVRGVWAGIIGKGNHDGVIIRNVVDPYVAVDDYILRIPSNIKSATHNNGSFSRGFDEIYKQTAAERNNSYQLEANNLEWVLRISQKQLDIVRRKYEGTDQWLKAPNGEDSNLTEKQWLQVRTPNFKRWFGDWEKHPENASKVLDENGEPKVVYRGTRKGDTINPDGSRSRVFNTEGTAGGGSFYSSNENFALTYLDADDIDNGNAHVYGVFLNLRNPFIVDARRNAWTEIPLYDTNYITDDLAIAVRNGKIGDGNHDGVIIKNVSDFGPNIDGIIDYDTINIGQQIIAHARDMLIYEENYREEDITLEDIDRYVFDHFSLKARMQYQQYLDENFADDFIVFNSNSIKSATRNNGAFSEADDIYKQVIGSDGARRLDEAEGTTIRMDNLALAKQMEKAGIPVKKMWLATGWMRGAEGKWRYEIPDGKVIGRRKFNERTFDELQALQAKARIPISEEEQAIQEEIAEYQAVLLHTAKGTDISMDELVSRFNAWLKEKGYEEFVKEDPTENYDFSRLTDKERKRYEKLEKFYEDTTLQDVFDAPELFKAYPQLRRAPYFEADFSDRNSSGEYFNGLIRVDTNLSNSKLRSVLIHEIQHAIQEIEGFALGNNDEGGEIGRIEDTRNMFYEKAVDVLDSLTDKKSYDKVSFALEELDSGNPKRIAKAKELATTFSEEEKSVYEEAKGYIEKALALNDEWINTTYAVTAGEIESRNTQTRRNWGDKRRRNTPLNESEDVPREKQLIRLDSNIAETYNQPLNNDVDLDRQISVLKISETMPNVPFYQRIKAFGKEKQKEIISRFSNGAVVNEHTGLTITLSKVGLNHILDTARNNDNIGGAVIYQAVPYLDSLAKNAYRVETHRDLKPSATKIEGQSGNLKQVHRFLVPVELNSDIHILKLTAKEYESGEAEIDEVSLYDMKYTKKMSAHPSQNSPNLMRQAAGTIGSTDSISVRDMLEGVNDVYGNPYSESYNQIIGVDGARRLDEAEGVTTRMDNLRRAKRMVRNGIPNAKIWAATGWTRGAEGKWRYEIPDGKLKRAKFNRLRNLTQKINVMDDMFDENPNYTFTRDEQDKYDAIIDELADFKLSDIFDAPDLFAAYPDIRNISVFVADLGGANAMYDPAFDCITINDKETNSRNLRLDIIHEIQHAIQHREGFATGSNYDKDSDTLYKRYEQKVRSLWNKFDKKLQTQINRIQNAERNGHFYRMQSLINSLTENEFNQYNDWVEAINKLSERNNYLFSKYERHAGEVEARNTETRAYWNSERRRTNPLDKTEDVARDEQIIGRLPIKSKFKGGVTSNSETYNQIIGEHGAQLIDKAIGAEWLSYNLDLAKNMVKLNMKPRTIKLATGWELGHDGKWKFEIPDGNIKKGLKLEATVPDISPFADYSEFAELPFGYETQPFTRTTLGKVFKSIELFAAYPELKNTTITFIQGEDFENNGIKYPTGSSAKDGSITLEGDFQFDGKYLYPDLNKNAILSLLHEIQHNIQRIEGFAGGSNFDMAIRNSKTVKDYDRKIDAMQKQLDALYIEHNYATEEESLFSRNDQSKEYYDLEEKIDALIEEKENFIKNAVNDGTARELYLRSAGETEARNIMTRHGMTEAQRRKKLLRDTEDYSHEELLDENGETFNQIVGRKAAIAMDKKNGNTNLVDNLNIAMDMTKAGETPLKIRLATGWELGTDNEWKYEIPDGNINVPYLWQAFQENKENIPFSITLRKLYDNNELFKAYPQLRNLRVTFANLLNARGYLSTNAYPDNPKKWIIAIDINHDIPQIQSTLIHEIQHAVQYIEGFALGGVGEDALFETALSNLAYNISRNQLNRLLADASDNLKEAAKAYENLYNRKAEKIAQTLSDKEKARWPHVKEIIDNLLNGYARLSNTYYNLGGEVEARNVQAREHFTPEQRRNSLLADTQDTNEWLITKFGDNANDIESNYGIVKVYRRNSNPAIIDNNEIYNQTATQRNNKQQVEADNLEEALKISQQQLDTVRKKYQGTDKWMKAPNGQPTNLTEKQWLQVRTPNFKRWFGDWENNPAQASKVVDANGEPLVVYHGAPNGGFSVFDVGGRTNQTRETGAFFASTVSGAEFYANGRGNSPDKQIYPVFLNMRNPYIHDAQGRYWAELGNIWINDTLTGNKLTAKQDGSPFLSEYEAQDYIRDVLHGENERYEIQHDESYNTTDDIIRGVWNGKLGDGNHDGVIFKDVCDPYEKIDEFITRTPENIKSATNNNGIFGVKERDIYKQTISTQNLDRNTARTVDDFLTPKARQQVEAVRAKYQGTDQWLKAPNGEKSNLTKLQWLLVRTPNFKRWFGDWENDPANASKALDRNGEPLVVYHGTPVDNIRIFKRSIKGWLGPAIYLTPYKTYANDYAKRSKHGTIMELFVNIRNPLVVRTTNPIMELLTILYGDKAEAIFNKRYENIRAREIKNFTANMENGKTTAAVDQNLDRVIKRYIISDEELQKILSQGNYDGISWYDPEELQELMSMPDYNGVNYYNTEYAVLNSQQIKSAIRNNGNFNGRDPEIYHQIASQQNNNAQPIQIDANNLDKALAISRQQLKDVAKKYRGTAQWLKAPNSKKSNLTEKQWLQVRTPNFINWFGDWINHPETASKVLDENGEPRVIYHGTPEGGFSEFDTSRLGAWFSSNKNTATTYSWKALYAVFINLRNPYIVDAKGNGFTDILVDGNYLVSDQIVQYVRNVKLGNGNHDGVIIKNAIDVDNSASEQYDPKTGKITLLDNDEVADKFIGDDFIVFTPSDIKSATRNNGNFGVGIGDIYKQTANFKNTDIDNSNNLSLNDFTVSDAENYFQIGTRRKREMDTALKNRRPDLSPEQRMNAINEIEKLGESVRAGGNPKVEKLATHWLLNGHIRLPEDNYKILDAIKICEQKHLNPMRYVDPNEILEKYRIKPSRADLRTDPDTVPELSNKADYGNGITVYTVDDTKAGQLAVRRIIDTHWGKTFNNWCLLARLDGNLDRAWDFWSETYNKTPKRIAFKNGKLLAFCASDNDTNTWWDREDEPHKGIPYITKENGNSVTYSYNETTGKFIKVKETLSDGGIREWHENGNPAYEHLTNGTIRRGYENGNPAYEYLPDDTIREWYINGNLKRERLPDGTRREWYDYGEIIQRHDELKHRNKKSEDLPNRTRHTWDKNGNLEYEKLPDGTIRNWHGNGNLKYEELPDGTIRSWYENGNLLFERLPDGTDRSWYDYGEIVQRPNGLKHRNKKSEELPNGTRHEWYENGNLSFERLPDGTDRSWYDYGEIVQRPNGLKHRNKKSEDLPNRTRHTWDKNGNLEYEYLPDGTIRNWHGNGNLEYEELPDGTIRNWHENGNLEYEKLPDGTKRNWYENGNRLFEYLPDGTIRKWYENGNPEYVEFSNETRFVWNDDGHLEYINLSAGTAIFFDKNNKVSYLSLPTAILNYENGRLRKEETYNRDILEWNEKGQITHTHLRDGREKNDYINKPIVTLQDGTIIARNKNGMLKHIILPNGARYMWFSDGYIRYIQLPNGIKCMWNSQGQPKYEILPDKTSYIYKDGKIKTEILRNQEKIQHNDTTAPQQLTNNTNETYNQIIGVDGVRRLARRTDDYNILNNLSVALKMDNTKKTPKEIRLATGWEKAPDGLWRYEIMDGTLIPNAINNGKNNMTLGELFDAPELYKAYNAYKNDIMHWLSGMSVQFKNLNGKNGTYKPNTHTIILEKSLRNNPKKLRSVLIHEIQHVIQTREGFTPGGSIETFSKQYNEYREKADKIDKEIQSLHEKTGYIDFMEQLNKKLDNGEVPISRLESIIKKFFAATPYADRYNELFQKKKKLWNNYKKRMQKKYGVIFPMEIYSRLGGEIEARNAAARADFTPEQRRNTLLAETQDRDNSQWIIQDSSGQIKQGETYSQSANTNNLDSNAVRSVDDFLTPEARQQVNAIRAKYKGTAQWLKAPNGKDTNLTELQWLLVRTPNFKRWFGDWENEPNERYVSKIIDENGEPLVVYHGTPNGGFSVFNTHGEGSSKNAGSFFSSNPNVSKSYFKDGGNNQLYAVFLRITNPYIVEGNGRYWNELSVVRIYSKDDKWNDWVTDENDNPLEFSTIAEAKDYIMTVLEDEDFEHYDVDTDGIQDTNDIARWVWEESYGETREYYDGIIFKDIYDAADGIDDGWGDVFIVEDKDRIKSATRNNGEYSSNPDIYKQSIGVKGAEAIDKANGNTTLADNFRMAQDMSKRGFKPRTIKRTTGWELGIDGKWRYELQDGNLRNPNAKKTLPLREFYDNDTLFKAYPKLGDINVVFDIEYDLFAPTMFNHDAVGRYDNKTNTIHFQSMARNYFKYLPDLPKNDYRHGEVKEIKAWLISQIQRLIQPIESFAPSRSPAWFDWKPRVVHKLDEQGNPYPAIIDRFPAAAYEHTAGETEARNAGRRAELTQKQRKETLLRDTEDIDRKEQLIIQRDNIDTLANQEANAILNTNNDNRFNETYFQIGSRRKRDMDKYKKSEEYYQYANAQNNPLIETYRQHAKQLDTFSNPRSEADYIRNQKQEKPKSIWQEIKHSLSEIGKGFRGDFPLLAGKEAKTKNLTAAREILRIMNRNSNAKAHLAMVSMYDALRKLNAEQFNIFSRVMFINDMYNFKKHNPDAALPMHFTPESLKNEKDKFVGLAKKDEKIMAALMAENENNKKARLDLVSLANKLGLKSLAAKLQKNDLFLIQYADLLGRDAVGSNNFNTNYVIAVETMRTMLLQDFEKLIAIKKLQQKGYDKKAELIRKFGTEKNKKYGRPEWMLHIPKGYSIFNPLAGEFISSAHSLVENVIGAALEEAGEIWGLSEDTMAMLREKVSEPFGTQLMVLPDEVTKTLKNMSVPNHRTPIGRFAKMLTNDWKKYVLYFPTRIWKYMFRNITGDLDILLAGDPTAVRFVPKAFADLFTAYYGDISKISPELKEFQARGGAITIESAQELGDYKQFREFNKLINELNGKDEEAWKKLPRSAWKLIDKFAWSGMQKLSDFREQLLRYAAYLDYLQQMQNNKEGIPNNWGASNKDEVLSIDDIRDRAFKMANELLGAYDQVSETGKQLRDLFIPFYSWIEVNAKRYWQLLKNGFAEEQAGDFTANLLKGHFANAPYLAYKASKTLLFISLFSLLVKAFNHFVWPDDEEKLPPEISGRPHITLGHDSDGNVLYFSQIGSLFDILEWTGLDTFAHDIKQILNGQQTVTDWIKHITSAPFKKFVNSLNPFYKTTFEMGSGMSFYPDFTEPRRTKDRLKYLAQSLGLAWPYKAITGEKINNWRELRNLFIYSQDANLAAYYYSRELVRQFKENVYGETAYNDSSSPKGDALRKMKNALRSNDKEIVIQALDEYYLAGGTETGLKQSLHSLSPLFGLNDERKKRFREWLSDDERTFLDRAVKYSENLMDYYNKVTEGYIPPIDKKPAQPKKKSRRRGNNGIPSTAIPSTKTRNSLTLPKIKGIKF